MHPKAAPSRPLKSQNNPNPNIKMNNENIHPNVTLKRGEPKERDGECMDYSMIAMDRSAIMTPMDQETYRFWSQHDNSLLLNSKEREIVDQEFDRLFNTPTNATYIPQPVLKKGKQTTLD